MYEVQVSRNGSWLPDSLFDDLRLAIFEAKRLEAILQEPVVRVVKENSEAEAKGSAREAYYVSGALVPSGAKAWNRPRKAFAGRHIVGVGGLVTVAATIAIAVLAL